MSALHEVCTLTEIESTQQPIHVNGVVRPPWWFFSVDDTLLVYKDKITTSSFTHSSSIVQLAVTPDNTLIFFVDNQGRLNLFSPNENLGLFSLCEFGKIRKLQLIATSLDQFSLLLVTEENILYWKALDTALFSSALDGGKTQYFAELLHRVVKLPCSSNSQVACALIGGTTDIVEISIPNDLTWLTGCAKPVTEQIRDPLEHLNFHSKFKKSVMIPQTGYCLALSADGLLFLFNLVAELCLGPIQAFSGILDFSIEPLTHPNEAEAEDTVNLPECGLILLRSADENDKPLTGDADSEVQSLILETFIFPSLERLNKIHVAVTSWLLSDSDLGEFKATDADYSTDNVSQVLFAEFLQSICSGSDSPRESEPFVRIRILQTVDAIQGVYRLLKEFRFSEARHLVQEYRLASNIYQKVVTAELRWLLLTLLGTSPHQQSDSTSSMKASDSSAPHGKKSPGEICDRILVCLDEVECIWPIHDLLERFLEVCMPTPGMQMKLLLSLKEKLFADKQSNEIEFEKYSVKIYSILKRLKAFLLLNGPERFSPSTWKTFLGSSIYTLFAFFLTTDGSIQPREIPCDPSKAFLIWNLYKNDLIKLLNQEALNLMCDSLSRRSLTFTPHPDQEFETQKQIFIESETAIHRWLRNELFPAVINRCPQSIHLIINFVIRRVKQLEAHSSVNETPDLAASGVSVCPFSWPDFAISWTEGFLNAVSLTSGGSETVYLTPGDKVKAYMTGLGSLDPKVDPLGDLRKLAKQLRTIETLRKVYGCRLSLANCDAQTELSIAYRILDIPFNLGMSLSGGVDGLTAKYLEDRKIDLETFHQGYALDLCRRIKVALEQSDSVIGFDYNTQPIDPSPSAESESHAHDPKALVLQACVVAEWITVPLCRIKVVYKLASLAPLPWPKELLQLVDKVLSHARANKLLHSKPVTYGRAIGLSHFKYAARMHQLSRLERLVSIARVQEILSRYSLSNISCVEIDSDVSIDIARHAVCCIMYNFSNPFSVRSATNTFDTSVPKMNEQVLRDSATIARELIVCEEWAVWFARVRMQIITEMASDLSILDENTPDWEEFRQSILEQRVSFVLDQLDESTECLYSALVGDSNQDSRPGKIPPPHHLIKRFLGLNCLRSIEFTLRLLPFNESSQICILLELAIAISQTIIWTENEHTSPLSSGCSVDLVQSSSFSIWLYQHSDNIQHALDVVHLIGSIRQLALSSLSERCHLVQLLTSCWVRQKNVGGLRLVYDGNLPLRNAYDQVLPDVNRSNREELLLWNWTTASLESLCEMVDDPKAETSFETSSTTLRSICTSLIENLQSITQQSETKTPRNSCSAQKRLAPPTASASVLSACPFCMRLWNSPLGRLGCVLQLWHDSVFPLVTQILSRASNLTSDDVNYVLSAVSYSLHTLFLLVFRSVGHSGSKVSKLGKDCTCQIQSLRPQIQGLLQILQAYDVSFSALTNACSSTVSDPLNRWTFSSMFSETPFGTVDLPLNCSIESLSWLSNLFGWLLRLNARSCDGNSPGTLSLPNENRLNALERLADVSMDLASIWSTQYGLRLKMAVPLLYGAHRLLFHKTKCDLWTEENNRTPNSGSALLNSPKLSQNFRERWSLLCTRCFVAALETTLNPTEGKYLDQTLVLGLALSVPIEDATTIVRSVVASSRDAPKKIKAIASIMYIFSLVAPERGSNFLHTSISMAKLWSWKAGLKPYGLNLSHLVAGGESAESYAVVLNKLCRIVPSPEQRSGSAPVGVLLPSDTSCVDGPRFSKTDNSSDRARLLPPIRILVNFARDFQLPLRIALMSHLKSLFLSTSGNSLTSTTNQPVPSFDFPGLDGFAGLTTESFVAKQKESNAEKLRFCVHQQIVLRRATLVLSRLMALDCYRPCSDIVNTLRDFYNVTSSYEYERLQFLLAWIAFLSPESAEPHRMELLKLLQMYKRVSLPTSRERELTSSNSNDDPISFSTSEWNHPYSNSRMPFHELLSNSPPMQIIGNEVTTETVHFWLKIDELMKWNIADSLRLLVAKNLVFQFDCAGLLPLANARKVGHNSISTAAGWDRALPCQNLLKPLFISLRSLLQGVSDHYKVMHFLAGLSRRALYGPHRLALLQLTKDLSTVWLDKLNHKSQLPYSKEHPSWSEDRALDAGTFDKYQTGATVHLDQHTQWTRIALERVNASYKQLAMEACLYQHHLAGWEEVNEKIQHPHELIHGLLSKVASVLVTEANFTGTSSSSLPISLLSLRQRLLKVLPRLALLGDLDYSELASRMLLSRLNLPSHILSLRDPELTTVDPSNQSILLDTSIGQGHLESCDITLNSTVMPSDCSPNPPVATFTSTEKDQPVEEDFVVTELILRDATVRRDLLPNLYSFIFTGDPSTYLASRWCAARCVLRTQLSILVWPQISTVELRDTLLRLALLAECKSPAHQRLILESSRTQSSPEGGTFTTICISRLSGNLQQLLASSSNPLEIVDISAQLIIDFELTEVPNIIIVKLLTMIHKHMAKLSTAYLVRLVDYLLSTDALWKCFSQSSPNSSSRDRTISGQFLSDFMHRLFTGTVSSTAGPPGQLFNRILSIIINWPLPDPLFEQTVGRWAPLVVSASIQVANSRSPNAVFRVWLLIQALHLLVTSCSTEISTRTLSDCIIQASNSFCEENSLQLTSQAVNGSELYLTAACLNLFY